MSSSSSSSAGDDLQDTEPRLIVVVASAVRAARALNRLWTLTNCSANQTNRPVNQSVNLICSTKFQVPSSKMGQSDLSPCRLRPRCGSISHPLWLQSRLDTQWESSRFFFINLAISPTVAVSISAGYRSGFAHILILSVAKQTNQSISHLIRSTEHNKLPINVCSDKSNSKKTKQTIFWSDAEPDSDQRRSQEFDFGVYKRVKETKQPHTKI